MNEICPLNNLSHMGTSEDFQQKAETQSLLDEAWENYGRLIQVLRLVFWGQEPCSCLKLPVMKSPMSATCLRDLS